MNCELFILTIWFCSSVRCQVLLDPSSCRGENQIGEEFNLRAEANSYMFWISRISQGELLEYIRLEVKKLNLLEILQWRVQTQCYIPKFPPFVTFQAGTRWGDTVEEAVLEFTGDLFGLRDAGQHHGQSTKNTTEEMPQEEKRCGKGRQFTLIVCQGLKYLNRFTRSGHVTIRNKFPVFQALPQLVLPWKSPGRNSPSTARQQRVPMAVFWSPPSFLYPETWHRLG